MLNQLVFMEQELEKAAKSGDVEFLKRVFASYPNPPYNDAYFLSTYIMGEMNFFHLAASERRKEFIKQGIKIIPSHLLLQLLSQPDSSGWTLLHYEASREWGADVEMVREILGFYKTYKGPPLVPDSVNHPLNKPWLAVLSFMKWNPLLLALNQGKEEIAMEIMEMDMDLLCNMVDEDDNSPLFHAVKRGFNRVAEKILKSDFSYSLSGRFGSTPLHYASNSSEHVLRLLLEKHEDLLNVIDEKGFNVLHRWAELEKIWPIESLLKWDFPYARTKIFMDLIYKTTDKKMGDTPLHIAVRTKRIDIVQALVGGYQQEMSAKMTSKSFDYHPWIIRNKDGDTPLHVALSLKLEETILYFLSIDPTLCHINNGKDKSTLFLALSSSLCKQVVEKIFLMSQEPQERSLDLQWIKVCPDEMLRYLLEKYPYFVVNSIDQDNNLNVLHHWSEMGQVWPLNYLLDHHIIPDVKTKVFRDFMYMADQEMGDTPLHVAARKDIHILQALVGGYQQEISGEKTTNISLFDHPPWKIKNKNGDTPLHVALSSKLEEIVLYFLSADPTLSLINNGKGESTTYIALASGYHGEIVEQILKSEDLISPQKRSRNLQWLKICPESILKYLLENYPLFMDDVDHESGFNIVHLWAEIGQAWPLNLLLEHEFPDLRTKVFRDHINMIDNKMGDTPLHIAARANNYTDFVQAIVRGYKQEGEIDCPPWKIKNSNGDTPLHVALSSKNENVASFILLLDSTLCDIHNNNGESPLFIAVAFGCEQVIEEILKSQFPRFSMLLRNDNMTVLHFLSSCTDKTCKRLLGKFWWIIDVRDDNGRTALDKAREDNVPWLITLLTNPSSVHKEPFDWVTTCKREEISTLRAFIDNCPDLQLVCREQNDTPLHHIKLPTYEEYKSFLTIPSIANMKNITDKEGATPLHRALQRKDIDLSKALLTDNEVERNIKDHSGITAMDLLAKLWKDHGDWAKMCEQIKVYPYLKTIYIQPGTNMDQMRSTLSVVAALLATITFAAGFTLPGGLDNSTGYAMLAKKVAFQVFLLADAYAMCTSMVVLFCLIWSMISERDMSYFLIDRSVVILMQSLYGTMLAFMTGIYVVTAHDSLWAAIVVLILCSLIGISLNRTVLHKILVKILPASNKDDKNRIHFPEEGIPLTSSENNDLQV